MTCDAIRQLLLSLELDEASRQRTAEALTHLESCQACRKALQDFDRLSSLLESEDDGCSSAGAQSLEPTDVAPAGGWRAFETKLLEAARGPDGKRAVDKPSFMTSGRGWIPTLAGLAAMVLVGWAAFHLGRQSADRGTPIAHRSATVPSRTIVAESRLSPETVARRLREFDAIDQYYNGQTRWLMLSPDSTDIDVNNHIPETHAPTTRIADGKILVVRLNLMRGSHVVSEADVLIVAGTTANVLVPTKLGRIQYHIVTCAGDPMRLRVELQVPQPAAVQSVASSFAPGSDQAILGASLDLKPYMDASAGRVFLNRQALDLRVAAAASSFPGT